MTTTKLISFLVLLLYFAVLLTLVIREKKSKTVLDFFFAGKTLPFWALSISFIASWWGAASAISTADLAFEDGLSAFWYYGVPVLVSTFILILFSKFIYRIGFLTQGEMMQARYSKVVAKMLSMFIILFMTVTAASQMVGVGDLFARYLGWSYETSVLVGTFVVLIYSVFGGFRGVVLTDIIQFGLLLISAVAVFVVAYNASGGWDVIVTRSEELKIDGYTNIFSGFGKYYVYIITFGCSWVIAANVWQRISAAKTSGDAKKMAIMSFFAYIPLYLIVVFTGMAAMVLYDKIPSGGVVPSIIIDYMHPVVGAVVFVGLSAAIMSTMDSLINTGAMTIALDFFPKKRALQNCELLRCLRDSDSVTYEGTLLSSKLLTPCISSIYQHSPRNVEAREFCKGLKKQADADEKAERNQLTISKVSTLVIVLVGLLIALRVRSILEVAWIASDIITTGLFIPLVAGFFWRRGTSRGAFASMIFGSAYCLWNVLVRLEVDLPTLWEQGSASQVLIGITISAIIYVATSLLTKPEYEKADEFIRRSRGRK